MTIPYYSCPQIALTLEVHPHINHSQASPSFLLLSVWSLGMRLHTAHTWPIICILERNDYVVVPSSNKVIRSPNRSLGYQHVFTDCCVTNTINQSTSKPAANHQWYSLPH